MATSVLGVAFDCADPIRQAAFWATVLSYEIDQGDTAGDGAVGIVDPTGAGPNLFFIPVPEPKATKNRLHLDLAPETSIEVEVERLTAAGGRALSSHHEDPYIWTVMQDPEGNEFCVAKRSGGAG